MRRVFTCLTSGWQTAPFIHWRKAFFLENPDCPTLVAKQSNKTTKVLSQRARGSRETLFFFYFYLLFLFISFILFTLFFFYFYLLLLFISFILLIQFNFVTYVPSRRPHTTTARVHCQVKSGPVSRSNRAPVRLCAPYLLARARTTSTDAPRSPNMLAPSSVKRTRKGKQKSRKIEENGRKSLWTLAVTSQFYIKIR